MEIFGLPFREGRLTRKTDDFEIELEIDRQPYGIVLSGRLKGKPRRLQVCRLPLKSESDALFLNNWQSWGPARVISFHTLKHLPLEQFAGLGYSAHPLPESLKQNPISDYFIVAEGRLLGFLSSSIGHPFFVVEGDEVAGYIEYFDREFEDFVPIEKMVILDHRLLEKSLELYADLVRMENAPAFSSWNPVGWCSWYQYFDKLTWKDIEENLELAESMEKGYEFFQIDDSWQVDIGDWRPKESFPELEEMASAISSKGFVPGLWLAPFSVAETSQLAKNHPEWLVKDESGSPLIAYRNWDKAIYALDTSHPEALRWLENLFVSFKKAGFRYFKIDFLFAGAVPGKRYKRVSPVEAYREGLKVIRKTLDGCFILGCGAPLLPSVGYVDGMRIGPDTAPTYQPDPLNLFELNAYTALKNAVMRYFTHGRWWWNDPDCLLLRREQTGLDDDARRIYALVSGALDNMLVESDYLAASVDKGLWKEALKLRGGKVEICGLSDNEFVIMAFGTGRGDLELLCNLEEKRVNIRTLSLPLEKRVEKREDGRFFHYYEGVE